MASGAEDPPESAPAPDVDREVELLGFLYLTIGYVLCDCESWVEELHLSISSLRCVDCEDLVSIKDTVACGGARCSTRRCKPCHNSRRSCRVWYQNAKRTQEWEAMSHVEKRNLVVKNKHKGAGRGIKRQVIISEKAECTDSLKLESKKPFKTKKQFPASNNIFFGIYH